MVEVNSARISATEEKSYNLGLSLKAVENQISKRFHAIEEKLGISKVSSSLSCNKDTGSPLNPPSDGLEQMRSDIVQLEDSASTEKNQISSIKAAIDQLTNKLDSTIIELQNSTIPMDEFSPRIR